MSARRIATRYPVLPALADRWSPRSFAASTPSGDMLRSMFEAARLAPSAHNSQPVRFLVGRKGAGTTYDRLFACLSDDNRTWANRAPVLILGAVMRERFSQFAGRLVPYPHCMHDLGLAVMSLIVQAQALGLHCHPMAAFDPEAAQAAFAIPPLFEPGMIVATGYLGEPGDLPPELRARETRPRVRRPLEDLVFEEEWGVASPLFGHAG